MAMEDGLNVIKDERIAYKEGNTNLNGYLAYSEGGAPKRPGVLVIHDWLGIGRYVEGRVRQLAGLGYVAFAVDIYGRDVRPKTVEEAGNTSGIYKNDRPLARRRAQAGLSILAENPLVDPNKIVVIGYCFGGTVALELARSGAQIAGVCVFHASLNTPTPHDAKNIKGKVLALQGGDDPMVQIPETEDFIKEMRDGGVDWQLTLYGGALHSYSNPYTPKEMVGKAEYDEHADRRSWRAMKNFFDEIFAVESAA